MKHGTDLLIPIMLVALLLMGAPGAYAQEGALTGAEIGDLLPGKSVHATTSSGTPFQQDYSDDGNTSIVVGSGFRDTGMWTVEGDLYCVQWKKIRDGKKGCWKVIRKDAGNFVLEGVDGMDDFDVRIE